MPKSTHCYLRRAEKWSPATITACNHPNTEADQVVTHHACLLTPKDLMIEGFKNPHPNEDHKGSGWCNVATTQDFGNEDPDENEPLQQFINDIASVLSYITNPKGIVLPTDPNGDLSAEKYECVRVRKRFDTHCSNLVEAEHQNEPWKDHLGFAHSMGAIAASVYNLPIQQFGGSVIGPGLSHKNNCDPIPWVTQIGHRVALGLRARMTASDSQGNETTVYQICSEMTKAGKTPQNCVDTKNWDYVGRPMGPGNCYEAGEDCTWAAWCGANPYNPSPSVKYTGRHGMWKPDCSETLTGDLAGDIEECFRANGNVVTNTYDCIKAAFVAYSTWFDEDHAFDGEGKGDGYRPITGANWGEPRIEQFGQFPICPDGWVPGDSDNHSRCCTVGIPDGAACGSDGDCCSGLTCNAGRCEGSGDCDETGGTGGTGSTSTTCVPE